MATEYEYIINSVDLNDRYQRLSAIIKALEDQQLLAVANIDIEAYTLDDGQTRINTQYRSAEAIAKAIRAYEQIRNSVQQKLLGTRIVALRDAKTVKSNGYY